MQTEPDRILPLSDPSAGLALVGGEGGSLARLTAAGVPVPPGFHITTAAYRRFVAEHGLQEQDTLKAYLAGQEAQERGCQQAEQAISERLDPLRQR